MHPVDRLDDPAWLGKFLDAWALRPIDLDEVPSAASRELEALRSLRQLIRRLAEAASGDMRVDANDVATLNRVLAGGPEVLELAVGAAPGDYTAAPTPTRHDWDWALARIAASFALLLAEGDPTRLRRCDNPDCRWWFYDQSRSQTRRWCDSRVCGNLMKVRRFRARRIAGRAPATGPDDD